MSTTSTGSSSPPDPGDAARVPRRAEEVRALASELHLTPSRRLGQSFLVDPFIADAEAALVGAPAGTPVLEIGGGFGLLTEALLRRGLDPLTVLEKDRRLAGHLRRAFGSRIRVVEGDAGVVPLPPASVVVGNLPFSVATPILQRLWREGTPRVVAMVQREVAERLTAAPGTKAYGRLTLQAALHGRTERFQAVPSSAFEPEPAVEGQLIVFEHRSGRFPVRDVEAFEAMVRTLFSTRRKQLKNLLPRVTPGGRSPEAVAREAGWPADWAGRRPEEIAPEAYFRLSDALAGPSPLSGPARRQV